MMIPVGPERDKYIAELMGKKVLLINDGFRPKPSYQIYDPLTMRLERVPDWSTCDYQSLRLIKKMPEGTKIISTSYGWECVTPDGIGDRAKSIQSAISGAYIKYMEAKG